MRGARVLAIVAFDTRTASPVWFADAASHYKRASVGRPLDNLPAADYNFSSCLSLHGSPALVWIGWVEERRMPLVKKWELSTPEGEYPVHSLTMLVGEDILTCLWGGTDPHIGAVAVALPRPSTADPQTTSSTSSVFTALGHKEDAVVKLVSERLSSRLNKNVAVTAGIHWDHLDADGIAQIMDNCRWLAEQIANVVEREA